MLFEKLRCSFPAGGEMSTKRKAESHSRATSRPRIMKSGDSQVDSERDSGFSGGTLLFSHLCTLT